MLVVSKEVQIAYANFLSRKGIVQSVLYKYQKWLRFYLDFCHKYQHEIVSKRSLDAFLMKLTEKRQSEQSRNEAKKAV